VKLSYNGLEYCTPPPIWRENKITHGSLTSPFQRTPATIRIKKIPTQIGSPCRICAGWGGQNCLPGLNSSVPFLCRDDNDVSEGAPYFERRFCPMISCVVCTDRRLRGLAIDSEASMQRRSVPEAKFNGLTVALTHLGLVATTMQNVLKLSFAAL